VKAKGLGLAPAAVRDLREHRAPATAEELHRFETDMLAGSVLARALAAPCGRWNRRTPTATSDACCANDAISAHTRARDLHAELGDRHRMMLWLDLWYGGCAGDDSDCTGPYVRPGDCAAASTRARRATSGRVIAAAQAVLVVTALVW